MWLCMVNRINRWDNLNKKRWLGPKVCNLCKANEESVNHIFVCCPFARAIIDLCEGTINCFFIGKTNLYQKIYRVGFKRIGFASIFPSFLCGISRYLATNVYLKTNDQMLFLSVTGSWIRFYHFIWLVKKEKSELLVHLWIYGTLLVFLMGLQL